MNSDHKRAAHFKAETLKLRQRIRELEREVKATRAIAFADGSGMMMAAVHAALNDGDLSLWISQRLLRQRTRVPPFHLSPEKEAMVRAEVGALLRACGVKSKVEDIAL
jgi:hypothetical protein